MEQRRLIGIVNMWNTLLYQIKLGDHSGVFSIVYSFVCPLPLAYTFLHLERTNLTIVFECLLLTMSETGFPKRLFEEYLPILGPAHGLGCLGVFQALYVLSYTSQVGEEADIQDRSTSPLALLRALPSSLKLVTIHHRLFQHYRSKLLRTRRIKAD
jgi:hypothetical protein